LVFRGKIFSFSFSFSFADWQDIPRAVGAYGVEGQALLGRMQLRIFLRSWAPDLRGGEMERRSRDRSVAMTLVMPVSLSLERIVGHNLGS
jgi:hypothetical protein